MYRVRVVKDFSSAHNLRGYEGNCEKLHGHNWVVEAYLAGEELDKTGMLVDFKVLKKELNKILDKLDHTYLNEVKPFDVINPTSENISKFIYDELKTFFGKLVERVVVWESAGSAAEYYES